MIILASTDALRVVTTAAVQTWVHVSAVDLTVATAAVSPLRQNSSISTATTTAVLSAPASGTVRTVKTCTIRNAHATTSQTVTVVHYDGTLASELLTSVLPAGYAIHYDESRGWSVRDTRGREVGNNDLTVGSAAVNALNLATLAADVTNNNGVANTIQDVTGLSFAVVSGETYWFRFTIQFTSAATTTGSRWSINGPAASALRYDSCYSLTATTLTFNEGLAAYDLPAASNATSAATGSNMAFVEGFITPSADGTVIARFASEVASSAIVAKAGSMCQWVRTL